MSRGGIFDRETGEEVIWPSQMIDKEMDSEALALALGDLLNVLIDRDVITPQDVIDVIPGADRWYSAAKPSPSGEK